MRLKRDREHEMFVKCLVGKVPHLSSGYLGVFCYSLEVKLPFFGGDRPACR